MKVIHYSPHMSPGGPAALAADLARTLQADDCENVVVAPPCELISRLHAAKVKHISCRKPNVLTAWREIRRLRSIIRRQAPDVVQVYSADAAWIVSMACRRLKKVKVPTIIGAITGYVAKGLPAYGWKFCDYYTTISRHLRNELRADSSPLKCAPWVIPYGTDESMCNPAYRPTSGWLTQWRKNHPELDYCLAVCIPGGITPRRGLEDVVPVLTGLLRSGIPAHVYIEGDPRLASTDYVNELKATFATAQLDGHITWLGARPDLRDVLCGCDVTLSLTRQPATWDRAVLEALALGRPVIAYDHGVVGELLEAFQPEGRVAPGDIPAIIDTLTQWNTYPPSPVSEIPYPYKLSDTADTYRKLYSEI